MIDRHGRRLAARRRSGRGGGRAGRPGAGVRALIAPAGYGKTTTLAAAVDAARRAGRPVLAVSTTNQAVGQLRQVGIPATTVARFALDQRRASRRVVW